MVSVEKAYMSRKPLATSSRTGMVGKAQLVFTTLRSPVKSFVS
jgi:hypothetical protein